MNKRVIIIIIIFSSVSLIAAIVTQFFWARDAVMLKHDQFAAKVEIAMKSVVNQLLTSSEFEPADPTHFDSSFYEEHFEIFNVVAPSVLDSLLKSEISSMRIDQKFIYGVYRERDSVFVIGNKSQKYTSDLLYSGQHISLSCLCEEVQYILAVYFPNQNSMIFSDMTILPVMSGLFLMVLVFSFFFTIYSLFKQKKLSEMKTDFVNNMTHEFKTPISTISASSEMLIREPINTSPDKVVKYAKIIFDENTRLRNLVERVLQIATVEKGDVKIKMKELDLHEILNDCIKNFSVQVQERDGSINSYLHAKQSVIRADRAHLVNVFNNLLDNANKYSPEKPNITITTQNTTNSVKIMFKDKGVGIRKEDRQHIFKKFHRLQTGDIHDVKGFGIGLFYVKAVVEEMGGLISVTSEKDQGSVFTIEFPLI